MVGHCGDSGVVHGSDLLCLLLCGVVSFLFCKPKSLEEYYGFVSFGYLTEVHFVSSLSFEQLSNLMEVKDMRRFLMVGDPHRGH